MRIYSKVLRVSHYYLFDPLDGRLEGYSLDPVTFDYVRMPALANGDLPCPRLGLHLGIRRGLFHGLEADWLRWLDEAGHLLPTGAEQARAAQDEARAAQDETRAAQDETRAADERAAAAEQRLAEALAELERLRAERR